MNHTNDADLLHLVILFFNKQKNVLIKSRERGLLSWVS